MSGLPAIRCHEFNLQAPSDVDKNDDSILKLVTIFWSSIAEYNLCPLSSSLHGIQLSVELLSF